MQFDITTIINIEFIISCNMVYQEYLILQSELCEVLFLRLSGQNKHISNLLSGQNQYFKKLNHLKRTR